MNLPINPEYEECLKNIDVPMKKTISVLKNIDINFYSKNTPTFEQDGDLFYHVPNIRPQSYIAAFDIDWTIAYAEGKLYPHVAEPNDIQILPNRKEELTILLKKGYTIALFTNQKVKSMPNKQKRVMRMTNLLNKLNIPCYVFIATGDDNYRKPNTGMWEKFKELIGIPIKYAFFVGDASGNPNTCVKTIKNNNKNFRDTDKLFAENIGINYYDVDEFFPKPSIKIEPKNGEKVMIVSVGMPGSGKSSFFENYLADYGFVHVERDTVKEKNRFINLVKRLINEGEELIYIDATNPTVEDRKVFYDLAEKHGYATATVYFVRNGHELNKMRDKGKVPDVVYHKFYNALEPPNENNTPGELYYFG